MIGKWQLGAAIKRFGLTTGNEGSLVISASTTTRAQMGTIRFSGTTAAGDLVFRDLPGMGGQLNQAAYLMSGRIGLVLDFADGTRDMKGFLASQGVATTLDGLGVLFQ